MTDGVVFSDETRDRSVLRKAEYDDTNPKDLVLPIPTRDGGQIKVPLLKRARSNIEREDYQENTLLRVKPLAEVASNLPVRTGGVTINQGKGVALLRPGFLYIFRKDRLWRELEISESARFSDVDLEAVRAEVEDPESSLRSVRPAVGQWLEDVIVPVFLQGQAVMHDFRMAYSEVQWDWTYIRQLEQDAASLNARTTAVGHAWAVTSVDSVSFETGFPASRIEDAPELRQRDLGIELMIENPSDFVVGFERPGEDELSVKLGGLLETPFDLSCESGEDQLAGLRQQPGIACVALADPLFMLRHSMCQLHLALHYLDAVDVSIQSNPMAHSAMLIRQAVFDPAPGGRNPLARYASAVDRSKLDQVLKSHEKQYAIEVIDRHLARLRSMLRSGTLDAVLEDYRTCRDVALCEGYLLVADNLNLLQQIPGVLQAQGVTGQDWVLRELQRWLLDGSFLSDWAPQTEDGSTNPLLEKLEALAQDNAEIDDALLSRLNLQSLVYLEKQLSEQDAESESGIRGVANAGKVGGMIAGSLNEWSSAVLTVGKRLVEEGLIQSVELPRIMQGAMSNFVLADPSLGRIEMMTRTGAKVSGSIIGVYGGGVVRGLTEFDRSEGVLTRAKDYLYADLLTDSGRMTGSTSPARMSDAVEEAIHKVAGTSMVFYAPDDHPEVRKLSLVKVDLAKRANKVIDGPAVSRGLVALAAFNVFLEGRNVLQALRDEENAAFLESSRFAGALVDLTAASLKLSEVEGRFKNVAGGVSTKMNRLATRALFDMKGWFFVGNRLRALGVPTLVRVVGLATFTAGSLSAGMSFWDMRISLAKKDFDAATGHAMAMTGSLIVLGSPLMHLLLAIPGWGWAVFGLALAVGGGLYAGRATDDAFEQLLKRGPWGTHPDPSLPGMDNKAYYSQLLSLLSPIEITAKRYSEVEPDPALAHPEYSPRPDDYVITIQMPLVSRLRLQGEGGENLPDAPFRLVVQEVAYLSASSPSSNPVFSGSLTTTQMLKTTPLTQVTARQSLPHQSAVRFLVRREITESDYTSGYYQESVTTSVRVGIQATVDTEVGPLVFPAPVFEDYEAFDVARHSLPPAKERQVLNPYRQPKSPYWYFTEVSV